MRQQMNAAPAAYTVREASNYLRVSPASVWRLLRTGSLARVRIGGRTVVRRTDLDALLSRAGAPRAAAAPDIFA